MSQPQTVYIQAPPPPPSSGFAVASLIFGIIGILGGFCLFGIPCIIAVACGHTALSDIKKKGMTGSGMAKAGLILGYICLIPAALTLIMGGMGALFQ